MTEKKSVLSSLFDLERIGRELATEIQTRGKGKIKLVLPDKSFLDKLYDKIIDVLKDYDDLVVELYNIAGYHSISPEELKSYIDLGELNNLINKLRLEMLMIPCGEEGYNKIIQYINKKIYNLPSSLEEDIGKIMEITGTSTDKERIQKHFNEIREKINKLINIAGELHRLNKEVREYNVDVTPEYLDKIYSYLNNCHKLLETANEILPRKIHELGKGIKLLQALFHATRIVGQLLDAIRLQIHDDVKFVEIEKPRLNIDFLRKKFEEVSNILGRRVGYLIYIIDKPSWSALINDVANMIHIIAEELEKLGIEFKVRIYGKCIIPEEGASEEATKLCIEWNKHINKLKEAGEITSEDYDSMTAVVYGNNLYIRIGGVGGHAIRMSFTNGIADLFYQDITGNVIDDVQRLFEECRCSCAIEGPELRCICYAKNDEDLKCLADKTVKATILSLYYV